LPFTEKDRKIIVRKQIQNVEKKKQE